MLDAYLSVLVNTLETKNRFDRIVSNSKINWGYIGFSKKQLLAYVRANSHTKQILLVEVSFQLFELIEPKNVFFKENIFIVAMGVSLPVDQIAFVQNKNISGFVSKIDIDESKCQRIVSQIVQKGYVANEFVPENKWINKPKHTYPRVMPSLTQRQYQVMTLLCKGKTGVEIAQLENTSEAT